MRSGPGAGGGVRAGGVRAGRPPAALAAGVGEEQTPRWARNTPRSAAEWYKQGSKAIAKDDWDRGILAFSEAVRLDPGNRLYREKLRALEFRKLRGLMSADGGSHQLVVREKVLVDEALKLKQWARADELAEAGLQINPWSIDLNTAVAKAAAGRGYADVVAFCQDLLKQLLPDGPQLDVGPIANRAKKSRKPAAATAAAQPKAKPIQKAAAKSVAKPKVAGKKKRPEAE